LRDAAITLATAESTATAEATGKLRLPLQDQQDVSSSRDVGSNRDTSNSSVAICELIRQSGGLISHPSSKITKTFNFDGTRSCCLVEYTAMYNVLYIILSTEIP
jgi:hypothetical protein